MKLTNRLLIAFLIALPVIVVLIATSIRPSRAKTVAGSAAVNREEAYRANNIGVALLEQYKNQEAVDYFKRALQLDPNIITARVNLSIALYNLPDARNAREEAENAVKLDARLPQPHYILGLIAKSEGRQDDAIAEFNRVLQIDPDDVGTNVNLGQIFIQQRKFSDAIEVLRKAMAAEPYNTTAIYNLSTALMRSGDRAEGQKLIQRFQELRAKGSGTTIGQNYLEQGRYAEAIASTGAEPDLVNRATPAVSFTDASAVMLPLGARGQQPSAPALAFGRTFPVSAMSDASGRVLLEAALGSSVALFDYDGDGDLDMFELSSTGQHLYRNDGGIFVNVTEKTGALDPKRGGMACVAGDYDNDGKADLFVVRNGGLELFHNDGNGKFSNVTIQAGIPQYPYISTTAAFVDVDHDGDLDIFVGGLADLSKIQSKGQSPTFPTDFAGAPNMLLRNDGNGKFTDVTSAAKVDRLSHAVAVIPTDFNNSRDVDLLVVNYGAAPNLYSNQRDGSFKDVAREVGLTTIGKWTSAAAGDVNKDRFTDFFFGEVDGPGIFALSDGKGKFKIEKGPAKAEGATAAQFIDYDNDGLLDLVTLSNGAFRVYRNVGSSWIDVSNNSARVVLPETRSTGGTMPLRLVSGDLDSDGDTDVLIVLPSGGLRILRNEGGNKNNSIRVGLTGRVSNKSGIGVKVEARAGSLVQKLETYSVSPSPAPADVLFGLGNRSAPDAVRLLWPAGIVQAETEIPAAQVSKGSSNTDKKAAGHVINLPVTELDRKPSSCPFLYAWNGERFEFVTDFMGGGEMGYLEEPGRYNIPDPDEYVRIRGDQLKEKNGRFELRVTNELEEALFVDHLQLIAVAHPADINVYPNEGMIDPPLPPFKLYSTRGARPPLVATDNNGTDVLPLVSTLDRRYPDDFQLEKIRGYSKEHSLTLKLSEEQKETGGHTLLLLTGWTDYAWSSDNLSASQSGRSMTPPYLQVKDKQGNWKTVIENIGIPVGRPQTVTVDLTGKFLSSSREVRIVTNMRIYWDQILVDTSSEDFPEQMTRLDPVVADLHWRGFSFETSPDGREPYGYDYARVSSSSPWKIITGHYTREGDVRELLKKSDDMFVIARTGDELTLSFDATALPTLPKGWTRTFLLYADGFSKEMDINSASPDQLAPLPFHGMKRYPYQAPERYPMTDERRAYFERYNTRVVTSQVPALETTFAPIFQEQPGSSR